MRVAVGTWNATDDPETAERVAAQLAHLASLVADHPPTDGATAMMALAVMVDQADRITDHFRPREFENNEAARANIANVAAIARGLINWIGRQTGADPDVAIIDYFMPRAGGDQPASTDARHNADGLMRLPPAPRSLAIDMARLRALPVAEQSKLLDGLTTLFDVGNALLCQPKFFSGGSRAYHPAGELLDGVIETLSCYRDTLVAIVTAAPATTAEDIRTRAFARVGYMAGMEDDLAALAAVAASAASAACRAPQMEESNHGHTNS